MSPERTLPLVRILGEVKKSLDRLVETISEYQQPESAQKKSETESESKIAVRLPAEITEYYSSEQGERRVKNRNDRIRLRLEFVGVIIALVIAVLTLCSLFIFNGQLNEMRRQTEVSERPWLSVEAKPNSGLTFVNKQQPVVAIKFSIKNVGKSIAKNIQVDVKMFATSPEVPLSADAETNQEKICNHPQPVTVGMFDMFPDQPTEQIMSVSASPDTVTSQTVEYKGLNFIGLYVVGCVSYYSSFGAELHQTRFAYRLMGPRPASPDGKPWPPSDWTKVLAGFQIGTDVSLEQLSMMQELLARNSAY